MRSELQRRFSNNITKLYKSLLINVFFATLLQRPDMVERRRDVKTITVQCHYNVVLLTGRVLINNPPSIQFHYKFESIL